MKIWILSQFWDGCWCGVGNVMYMITAAKYYQKKLGITDEIKLILSKNENYYPDGFKDIFKRYITYDYPDKNFKIDKRKDFTNYNWVDPKDIHDCDNLILYGYYQDKKFIEEFTKDELRSFFDLKEFPQLKADTILSVRNYINVDKLFYYEVPREFYNISLDKLGVSLEDVTIVGNDYNYSRKLFPEIKNIKEYNILESLWLYINAKNIIQSNSTFSIWGSVLSNAENILVPPHYFSESTEKKKNNIYRDFIYSALPAPYEILKKKD